jgi:hypothetical protein
VKIGSVVYVHHQTATKGKDKNRSLTSDSPATTFIDPRIIIYTMCTYTTVVPRCSSNPNTKYRVDKIDLIKENPF